MSLNDEVDGWISQLMGCKPLSENEVKKLCDKVSILPESQWIWNPVFGYSGTNEEAIFSDRMSTSASS